MRRADLSKAWADVEKGGDNRAYGAGEIHVVNQGHDCTADKYHEYVEDKVTDSKRDDGRVGVFLVDFYRHNS